MLYSGWFPELQYRLKTFRFIVFLHFILQVVFGSPGQFLRPVLSELLGPGLQRFMSRHFDWLGPVLERFAKVDFSNEFLFIPLHDLFEPFWLNEVLRFPFSDLKAFWTN